MFCYFRHRVKVRALFQLATAATLLTVTGSAKVRWLAKGYTHTDELQEDPTLVTVSLQDSRHSLHSQQIVGYFATGV